MQLHTGGLYLSNILEYMYFEHYIYIFLSKQKLEATVKTFHQMIYLNINLVINHAGYPILVS